MTEPYLTTNFDYVDPETNERQSVERASLETVFDFQVVEIPKESVDARSRYFHKLMVLIEEKLIPQKTSGEIAQNAQLVKQIYRKVREYHRMHRASLDEEHKLILFCLMARLFYCLKTYDLEQEQQDFEICKPMLAYQRAISECDVYTLERTKQLTFNNFHCTRYSDVFKRHVKRLFWRSCHMTVFQTTNAKIMNHPLFCTQEKTSGMWHVNKQFMTSCDQLYASTFAEFFLYKKCVKPFLAPSVVSFDLSTKRKLLQWIYDSVKANFLSISEQEFREMIYALSLNPGERERFTKEDSFADPSAYNIIAKYRRPKFDALLDLFGSDTPLTDIVTKYLKREDGAWSSTTSDIMLISMCIPMLNHAFSCIYPGSPLFQDTFLIEKTELMKPSGPRRLLSLIQEHKRFELDPRKAPQKVPRLVYVMNEYYVLFGSRIYQCKDFLDSYLQWLYLCCSHRAIDGVPAVKINLLAQFVLFFPNERQHIERLRMKHEAKKKVIKSDLGMPQSYEALPTIVRNGEHVKAEKYFF